MFSTSAEAIVARHSCPCRRTTLLSSFQLLLLLLLLLLVVLIVVALPFFQHFQPSSRILSLAEFKKFSVFPFVFRFQFYVAGFSLSAFRLTNMILLFCENILAFVLSQSLGSALSSFDKHEHTYIHIFHIFQ